MKKYFLAFVSLIVVFLIAACGTATTEDNAADENTDASNNDTEQIIDENENADVGSDENGKEGTMEEEIIQAEVIFVGLADPHTIEVEKDGEAMALQILDPRVADVDFESVKANTPVVIEYYVNKVDEQTEQNILTSFEIKG